MLYREIIAVCSQIHTKHTEYKMLSVSVSLVTTHINTQAINRGKTKYSWCHFARKTHKIISIAILPKCVGNVQLTEYNGSKQCICRYIMTDFNYSCFT